MSQLIEAWWTLRDPFALPGDPDCSGCGGEGEGRFRNVLVPSQCSDSADYCGICCAVTMLDVLKAFAAVPGCWNPEEVRCG